MNEFELICDSYLQWLQQSMLFENVKRTRRPASNLALASNYDVTRNGIKYVIYLSITFKTDSVVSSIRVVQSKVGNKPRKVIFKESLNFTSTWNDLLQWYENATYNVFRN